LVFHVLRRRFKIFKWRELKSVWSSFPNNFRLIFLFFLLLNLFSFRFCATWFNLYLYTLETFPIGWCRSWIKCVAFVLSWLEVGQDRLLLFVLLILINFYFHRRASECPRSHGESFIFNTKHFNPQNYLIYQIALEKIFLAYWHFNRFLESVSKLLLPWYTYIVLFIYTFDDSSEKNMLVYCWATTLVSACCFWSLRSSFSRWSAWVKKPGWDWRSRSYKPVL